MTSKWDRPCKGCTRVQNPDMCENKYCKDWKAWFLRRWAQIHRYGLVYGKGTENELEKRSH
jgi:hypothetical protein